MRSASKAPARKRRAAPARAADILRVIDEIGVETVIITPGFTRPQSMFHQAMVTATAAAYNDFLINEVLPASPRIKAEIMINHRNPADGRRRNPARRRPSGIRRRLYRIRRQLRADRHRAATIRSSRPRSSTTSSSPRISACSGRRRRRSRKGTRTWTELVGISAVCISMAYVGSMIMQGLFDKFPTLRDDHQGRRLLVAAGIHGARRRLLSQPSRRHQAGRAQARSRRKIPRQAAERIFRVATSASRASRCAFRKIRSTSSC